MYVVISKWEIFPEQEEAFKAASKKMRAAIDSWPGVVQTQCLRTEDGCLAVITYDGPDSYHKLIQDPSGPFEKAVSESQMESYGRWVWSERGEEWDI